MEPEIDLEYQHAKWFKRKYINFLPFVVFKLTPGFSKDYFDLNEDDYPIFNEKKNPKELIFQ